ncbi:peptidoglycan-binding domain-containing protein [Chelativorans sp. AA-79]|uniref:peptidoglycan-binding domain-containing protein n=1 Tax=Chelativorans sp. AA-79 TaxID=3028735 RepID=UPI0023F62007|nr:peptidoglycan-binding domain-containing protein [Chelativorans sp. AA-79]WEX10866.1 peptidoglycan-binding domain-containing protein [Chelativorans sp. AA-79]
MSRTLSRGMTGQDVRALQDALNFHIRRGERLRVDGIFGPKTDAKVREFQRANKLTVDGLAGPRTQGELYETTRLTVPLAFMPNMALTPPAFGGPRQVGIKPPRLVPPLQWPGPPFPVPPPFTLGGSFTLLPPHLTILPEFNAPANVLGLDITIPTRKDPLDPAVASRLAIIDLIDDLPVNSKFKVFLINKVPNPEKKISPPGTGFDWGAEPVFDPFDPTGIGVKGNAAFSIRVSEGAGGKPNVVFGAWGDGKFFLDFTGKKGQPRPLVQAEGQLWLGFKGVF